MHSTKHFSILTHKSVGASSCRGECRRRTREGAVIRADGTKRSRRSILALVIIASPIIFVVDVLAFPDIALPAFVFSIPILIGAYFFSPRVIAAVAIWTVGLQIVDGMMQGAPIWRHTLYVLGTVAVAYLAGWLAARNRETVRLLEELTDSDERYQALFNSISDGFALFEVKCNGQDKPNGNRLLNANPAAERLVGAKREDLLGKCLCEIWPCTEQRVVDALDAVALNCRPVELETYNTDFGKWFEVMAFSPRKGLVGVLFNDITERKSQEADRERLLEQIGHLAEMAQGRAVELEAILDNMVDSVFVCNLKGQITLANQSGVHLVGVGSLEELKCALSKFPDFLNMRYPDGTPMPSEEMPLVMALHGKTVRDYEQLFVNQQTKSDVYIKTSAAPIRDEKGNITGAVTVARDITGATELERLKEQFVVVAAHELKTPVAIMKGYAQALLRKNEKIAPSGRKMLDAIDRGADRIAAIVQELLDISRLEEGQLKIEMRRVDLLELAQEVLDRMGSSARPHAMRLQPAAPVFVCGDRDRLEQVITNLVDNAVRYSPGGGDIVVGVNACSENAIISVHDQGVGIPKEKQGRIFERFYRAHTNTPYDYGGIGVGLNICKEIISRHGGRIWFDSVEAKGSTFYLSLPLAGELSTGAGSTSK